MSGMTESSAARDARDQSVRASCLGEIRAVDIPQVSLDDTGGLFW